MPDYKQKVGGACKNLTRMYECRIRSRGDTLDCKDKAQCLEIMVGFLKLGSGLELETKAIRRFAKISIVSYSRPSFVTFASASQFHVYLPWGQSPFSIVS